MPWLRILSLGTIVVLLVFVVRGAVNVWYDLHESRQDVIDQHAGQLRTVEEQLKRAGSAIPPYDLKQGAVSRCDGLEYGEQPFRLNTGDLGASNVGIVLDQQLTDPAAAPEQYDFVPAVLGELVAKAAPNHRTERDDRKPADDAFKRTVAAMAQVRYALVVQLVVVPSAQTEPSHLGYLASMVDLTTGKLLCRFGATAGLEGIISYEYPEGASDEARNRRKVGALRSALRDSALELLETQLNSVQQGTFELDGE